MIRNEIDRIDQEESGVRTDDRHRRSNAKNQSSGMGQEKSYRHMELTQNEFDSWEEVVL